MTEQKAEPLPEAEVYQLTVPGQVSPDQMEQWRRAWQAQMPGKRIIVLDQGAKIEPLSHLDAAWREVEAVLPKHWRHSVTPYYPSGWEAEAHDLRYASTGLGKHGSGAEFGDTPAAALQALAAKLCERTAE